MKRVVFASALALCATSAAAVDAPPAMIEFVRTQAIAWASAPEVTAAITSQNTRTANLSEDEIIALDNQWRAEVDATGSDKPLTAEVLSRAASEYLKQMMQATGGSVTEIIVMDARGLNVAQSGMTSDYWQGDEAKYQQTYLVGTDAIHVSDIELDESTQTYQGQVSMTIVGDDGQAIGAVTFGLNAQMFF